MSQLSAPTDLPGQQPILCRTCASPRVVHVSMDLTDGSPVNLVSCLECETRTWFTPGGEVLAISEVLDRAKKPTR